MECVQAGKVLATVMRGDRPDVPISLLQDGSKLQLKALHADRPEGGLAGSLSIESPGIRTGAFVIEPGAVISLMGRR